MIRRMAQALDRSNCGIGTARNSRTRTRMSGGGGLEGQSSRLPDSAFPRPESDRRIAVILHPPPELPTNPINDIFLSCVGN